MKELISLSLGPTSNFTLAHFWNFQDEWMKQGESEFYKNLANNPVLFYETQKTQSMVPRTIFVDFRNNFGNFLSVFGQKQQSEEEKQMWEGQIQRIQQDPIPKSLYQQELDQLEAEYQQDILRKEKEMRKQQNQINPSTLTGLSTENRQDALMKLMMQQMSNQEEEKQINTSSKAKHDENQQMTLEEQNIQYKFEEQSNYFTDFLQSQLTPKNQMILPTSWPSLAYDDFLMYSHGKQLWEQKKEFQDECEDLIRFQLEQCDAIQGFSVTCDSNSGHGSFLNELLTQIIKEEVPKSKVYLFNIQNNPYKAIEKEHQAKLELFGLNQGLFLSDLHDISDIIVPFETPKIGDKQSQLMSRYNDQLMYHQTGLYSLAIENILFNIYGEKVQMDVLQQQLLFGETVKVLQASMQVPFTFNNELNKDKDFLKNTLTNSKKFIDFSPSAKSEDIQKVISLHESYIVRGTDITNPPYTNLPGLKSNFEQTAFSFLTPQRGFTSFMIPQPHLLSVPYPRYFSPSALEAASVPEYLLTSLTKLSQDAQYGKIVKDQCQKLKGMKPTIRIQLEKEGGLERDELKSKVEVMERLAENFRQIEEAGRNDESEEDVGEDEDY